MCHLGLEISHQQLTDAASPGPSLGLVNADVVDHLLTHKCSDGFVLRRLVHQRVPMLSLELDDVRHCGHGAGLPPALRRRS